ncbi:transketolase [Anaerobaca lacustris]|uniref:Transketolase n=1 Tax=Anaerobaca lacustris TaxID=3044600 RepID=A0AAW6TUK0_9BACT|nr:transketolase [Sedimentisphaerales bacterium M17dextr]
MTDDPNAAIGCVVDIGQLMQKADHIRDDVLRVAVANGAGHIAPSLSCVEIVTALYHGVMRYDPEDPEWEDRDRLIVSKAHGCYAVYAALADMGVIPMEEWNRFYTDTGRLCGCMERRPQWGLEAGCGSLGHGLPLAVGYAFGARQQGRTYRVYCLVGDGEMQEGSMWESLQFAVKHRLDNLTVVVDRNRLQAMDFITEIMDTGPGALCKRLAGFGLAPIDCQGHMMSDLVAALESKSTSHTPVVVIANTVKGYGVTCMESVPRFHFRLPTSEELECRHG